MNSSISIGPSYRGQQPKQHKLDQAQILVRIDDATWRASHFFVRIASRSSFRYEAEPDANTHGQEHDGQQRKQKRRTPKGSKAVEFGDLRLISSVADRHNLSSLPCGAPAGHAGLECNLSAGSRLKAHSWVAKALALHAVPFLPQRNDNTRHHSRTPNERQPTDEVPARDDR